MICIDFGQGTLQIDSILNVLKIWNIILIKRIHIKTEFVLIKTITKQNNFSNFKRELNMVHAHVIYKQYYLMYFINCNLIIIHINLLTF